MVVSCEIVFDQNQHGTYFAGQIVSGNIILKTDKTKTVKGFALKINGCARTHWTENAKTDIGKGKTKRQSVTFYGTQDYIATTTYLLGSEDSPTIQIEPGIHKYTFSCALPRDCPSSFEGKEGHIRYVIKAVLFRPWKFDQIYTRGFTVLKLMDLNYESPTLRIPAHQETYRTFCCGPCSSQPLRLNVSVPQIGYVPGQDIKVTVMVVNESTVPVSDVRIFLVMYATLFSQQPKMNSRSERTELVKFKAGAVSSRSTRTITQSIKVPATPTSCLSLSNIIKICYQLEIEAKLKGVLQSPFLTMPIVIGNVPFVDVIQQQPLQRLSEIPMAEATAPQEEMTYSNIDDEVFIVSRGSFLPAIDPRRSVSDPLSSLELNIPPPSYEEAIFMNRADCNEDDSHALGRSDFVPRYPVYNIPQVCSPPEDEPFTNTDPKKSTWL